MTAGACRFARKGLSCLPALACGLLLHCSARAQPPLGADGAAHDLDLTIECRRLLLEDPVLGPLNLGVRVRDRVAILWGPAPSPEIRRRAEHCLLTMIELVDVEDRMHLAPDADWGFQKRLPDLRRLLPERMPPMLPVPDQADGSDPSRARRE